MTDLNFIITEQDFLRRTDSNMIKNQTIDEYTCHFHFENEEWVGVEKFAVFFTTKKRYTALLGEEMDCSTPIPFDILSSCVVNVQVVGEEMATKNHVSLVVTQPKEQIIYECQKQDGYHDPGMEAYIRMREKFDDVKTVGDDVVFYAEGKEVARLSLGEFNTQADWKEQDSSVSSFIKNKPAIVNNFKYENDNLICLSDDSVQQVVSLKHNHQSNDILDFDDEVDIDLNNLLVSLTENIRSL